MGHTCSTDFVTMMLLQEPGPKVIKDLISFLFLQILLIFVLIVITNLTHAFLIVAPIVELILLILIFVIHIIISEYHLILH